MPTAKHSFEVFVEEHSPLLIIIITFILKYGIKKHIGQYHRAEINTSIEGGLCT